MASLEERNPKTTIPRKKTFRETDAQILDFKKGMMGWIGVPWAFARRTHGS